MKLSVTINHIIYPESSEAMLAAQPHYQVLIVGAGPVGALCALLLGNYGVRTLIVDRTQGVMQLPRAISLDHEALRVLQAAGVLDLLREDMPAVPAGRIVSRYVGDLVDIDTQGVLDGHPKLVSFSQPQLERVMRAALTRRLDTELREGVECVELIEERSGITARLQANDGSGCYVQADYVIGADGANSFVRKARGIGFGGHTYQQDWLIVDVADAPGRKIDQYRFYSDPARPHVHVPGPSGSQRWEFRMMPGETREQVEQVDRIRSLLAPWGELADMRVLRTAVYRFHARTADHIRCGRVLLAGDSAHLTPPFAGQGLCAGLRDAFNLSWKIAWTLNGRARERILDSYEQERLPHVRSMIRLAVMIGRVLMPTNRLYACCRDYLIRAARALSPRRDALEESKVKPNAVFARGLFIPGRPKRCRLVPGSPLPQGIVRAGGGKLLWSDDALGGGLTLIGCGIDPASVLDAEKLQAWQCVGGECVFLRARQQNLSVLPQARSRVLEDEAGTYVGRLAPIGTLIIARPDRIVLGVAERAAAGQLVESAIRLLS
jgi:3-(3-hydroxy-phenyl)propionate hydroxylase